MANPVRRYMLEKACHKCSVCDWNLKNTRTGRCPLQIHHRDGNSENSWEENLQVLCPNCHALTWNYGSANKGNGRKALKKFRELEGGEAIFKIKAPKARRKRRRQGAPRAPQEPAPQPVAAYPPQKGQREIPFQNDDPYLAMLAAYQAIGVDLNL